MTTFNNPWSKFRWLQVPFLFKVARDVFPERLDRVLRGMPNTYRFADDVLFDGKAEVSHDKGIITQLETARGNNITFNCDKFVLKSKDLKFFGGNLTPEGYMVDPQKIQAITEVKPPQNLQHLQCYLGLINYLNTTSVQS